MTLNRAHPVDFSYDCAVLFVRGRGVLKHRRGPLTNRVLEAHQMAEQSIPELRAAVTVIAGALAA